MKQAIISNREQKQTKKIISTEPKKYPKICVFIHKNKYPFPQFLDCSFWIVVSGSSIVDHGAQIRLSLQLVNASLVEQLAE